MKTRPSNLRGVSLLTPEGHFDMDLRGFVDEFDLATIWHGAPALSAVV